MNKPPTPPPSAPAAPPCTTPAAPTAPAAPAAPLSSAPAAPAGYDVFIIYAGPDQPNALALRAALAACGRRAFVDAADLRLGDTWDTVIPAALDDARMVTVLVGPGWTAGATWYGPEEVAHAIDLCRERPGLRVVPLRMRAAAGARLPYGLRRLVGIDDADADWPATAARVADALAGRVEMGGDLGPSAPRSRAAVVATGQSGTGRADIGGPLVVDVAPAPPVASTHRLPKCGPHLFGRDGDLAWLDAAWSDSAVAIATLIAWGGAGKTTVARHWLDGLQARGWDGAARVYAWSFYSQGAGEDRQASADLFIDQMLRWLGDSNPEQGDPWEKGERLAGLIKRQRTLLILDGVEPLQHPPGPLRGQLKDPALRVLLECLADGMNGLCLVTSRLDLTDLADRPRAVRSRAVERLSTEAGVAFLGALTVKGDPDELAAAVEEYAGHALALRLLGGYLAAVEEGDIRRRDGIGGLTAAEDGGAHAWRVMAAYERWFDPPAKGWARVRLLFARPKPSPELAILRLLGLFDRAVEPEVILALRQPPVIQGLTDGIAGLGHPEWQTAVSHLRALGLLARDGGDSLDAHPLVREHFADRLRTEAPAAWQAGHERLYRHFAGVADDQPATLVGMEPLFRAVLHGCAAGRYEEALVEVYRSRISRGMEHYITSRLGAFAADLAALAGFFAAPWQRPQPALPEPMQAAVLNWAGFDLRALGRLAEAVIPLEGALTRRLKKGDWKNAARVAGNLAELLLTLGRLRAAPAAAPGVVERASEAVAHADRSGDGFQRMTKRTTLADALHQRGDMAEARALFAEAERLQAERQSELPLLYSVQGYW